MTDTGRGPASESRNRHSAALARLRHLPELARKKSISADGAKRLERDQQKWIPVLRPIALSNIENAHDLLAKPLTLWRIMR
jgi:hypothetical protein